MDREWAIGYLQEVLTLCTTSRRTDPRGSPTNGAREARQELTARIRTIIAVVSRAAPGSEKLIQLSGAQANPITVETAVGQALYQLENHELLKEKLGPPAGPELRADALHPAVWDAAQSFWRSSHRREAVQQAARSVNAQLQDRLGRRNVSEADAVRKAFTLDAPKPGAPRLRLMEDDGSPTFRTLHEGASAFGAGCFMAIRNPSAHEPMEELDEQEALEQLAAFSILARWVEQADIVTADESEDPA